MCMIITELLFHTFNIERLQKKAKVNTLLPAAQAPCCALSVVILEGTAL